LYYGTLHVYQDSSHSTLLKDTSGFPFVAAAVASLLLLLQLQQICNCLHALLAADVVSVVVAVWLR